MPGVKRNINVKIGLVPNASLDWTQIRFQLISEFRLVFGTKTAISPARHMIRK